MDKKCVLYSTLRVPAPTDLWFYSFFSLILPRHKKQNCGLIFILFKYFGNNLLLIAFAQNSLKYCHKNWITHYQKNPWHAFVQQPVRTVFAKFKFDRLSRFSAKVHWALTTQKLFINEIPLTMKTTTASIF